MGFQVEDCEFPAVFNPVELHPFRNNNAEWTVFQLRPSTVEALAVWCGGEVDGQSVTLPDGSAAGLGDFVVHDGDRFRVEPAGGAAARMWPRDDLSGDGPPLLHP